MSQTPKLDCRPNPGAAPEACQRDSVWCVLVLSAVVPLLASVLLYRSGVPLGCPGRLVYLYSPVVGWRLSSVPIAVGLGLAAAGGTWLAAGSAARLRRAGLALAIIAASGLASWSYYAPPDYRAQHVFNASSPSHDGAFVIEALRGHDALDYLRLFPQRAATPPAEMRGTRVVSNPPAATLLALGTERLLRWLPRLADLVASPRDDELPQGTQYVRFRHHATVGLLFFWVLTTLWLSAGLFLYLAARISLPPAAAVACSVCCVFSPMTLLFTPGKDPAQLLTVALPLYLWLRACRKGQAGWAILCGLATAIACLMSLVHVWTTAVIVLGTLAAARDWTELCRRALRALLPALVSGLAAAGLFWLAGVDLIAIWWAVARAQAEVTRGPGAMPLAWQLLGVPLFLLFAGPAWWAIMIWSRLPDEATPGARDADARLGRYLVIMAAAIMLATVGFTNLETPRLWIPFTPLLILGGLLQLQTARKQDARTALLLAALVVFQITVSALQWSLMDPRETETRLVERRFFG